jgi:starvation-inducible DNA-binding protein
MPTIEESTKRLWANNFILYTKAHGFHVNVQGMGFFSNHHLFQKVYERLQEEIDTLAEGLKTLREIVPFSLGRIVSLADVKDETVAPNAEDMIKILYTDLTTVIDNANEVFELTGDAKAYGLQNIVADYLQTVHKLCWMLESSLPTPEQDKFWTRLGKPETPTESYK